MTSSGRRLKHSTVSPFLIWLFALMPFNLLCILNLTYPMEKLTLLVCSCCSLGSVYERDHSPKSAITQSLWFLMTPQRFLLFHENSSVKAEIVNHNSKVESGLINNELRELPNNLIILCRFSTAGPWLSHTNIIKATFIFTFLTECLLYDSHDFCQHHIAVMYIIRKENRKYYVISVCLAFQLLCN